MTRVGAERAALTAALLAVFVLILVQLSYYFGIRLR
jgi:hypothetical protein